MSDEELKDLRGEVARLTGMTIDAVAEFPMAMFNVEAVRKLVDEIGRLRGLLKLDTMVEEYGAAIVKAVASGEDGKPFRAFLVIDGVEECADILPAVRAIEDAWDDEDAGKGAQQA